MAELTNGCGAIVPDEKSQGVLGAMCNAHDAATRTHNATDETKPHGQELLVSWKDGKR